MVELDHNEVADDDNYILNDDDDVDDDDDDVHDFCSFISHLNAIMALFFVDGYANEI